MPFLSEVTELSLKSSNDLNDGFQSAFEQFKLNLIGSNTVLCGHWDQPRHSAGGANIGHFADWYFRPETHKLLRANFDGVGAW